VYHSTLVLKSRIWSAGLIFIAVWAGSGVCAAFAQNLTPEEKAFLERKKEIVFVSQTMYPPFEFLGQDDDQTGMSIELARWIATEFGFQARFVHTHFQQAQKDVLSGKADVLTSLFYSPKRDDQFDFTQMIFEVPASIFVSSQRMDIQDITDLKGRRIAMQEGDYAREFLETRRIDFIHVPTLNFAEAVDQVIAGGADALIGDEQIVLYDIFKNVKADQIKKVGQPLYIGRNCMAVKESSPLLLGILDKGVSEAKKSGILDKINRKWIGTHYQTTESIFFRYVPHLFLGVGLITAIVLLIWQWNVRLRSAVRLKTDTLVQRERELLRSEQKLKAILEASPNPMVLYDSKGYPQYLNPEFTKVFGWRLDELKQRKIPYVPEEETALTVRKIDEIYRTGVPLTFETRRYTKDGKTLDVILSAAITKNDQEEPDGLVVNLTDISEKKKLETQIEQTQKIESLGTLAGGIAHDFNNLLSGIYGYLDLALQQNKDSKVARYIEKAFQSSDRARGLTHQLLTFSKGGSPIKKVEPLVPFIEETTRFAMSGSHVSCRFEFQNDLWMCNCDKNQIAQVIDNIVINACHAMPAGGTITVAAGNLEILEDAHSLLPPGPYVKISIVDAGIGIPKKYLSRIFDPFFSTKQTGSGLGLATSYSIIKRHGGAIDVTSEPGAGSCFDIYLPATGDTGAVSRQTPEKKFKGAGKVLIMDDEPAICDMLSEMISKMGFSVVVTHDGEAAVAQFRLSLENRDPFAAIVLDLTVPGGMGGKTAVKQIRKMDQKIPVFVASGYSEDTAIADPQQFGFTGSLEKPFSFSELSQLFAACFKR
jgi:PAS domain S-box-containing protein